MLLLLLVPLVVVFFPHLHHAFPTAFAFCCCRRHRCPHLRASRGTHGVELVDKQDGGRGVAQPLKRLAHAARAHAAVRGGKGGKGGGKGLGGPRGSGVEVRGRVCFALPLGIRCTPTVRVMSRARPRVCVSHTHAHIHMLAPVDVVEVGSRAGKHAHAALCRNGLGQQRLARPCERGDGEACGG
jgi:hypothetical protein